MKLSFNKEKLLNDSTAFNQFVKNLIKRNTTPINKNLFIEKLHSFLLNKDIEPKYFLFSFSVYPQIDIRMEVKRSLFKYKSEYNSSHHSRFYINQKTIAIPYYEIHDFRFFVETENIIWYYDNAVEKLTELSKWINDLEYLDYTNTAVGYDYSNDIKRLFGENPPIDEKELSDSLNHVFITLIDIDKYLLSESKKLQTHEQVLKFISQLEFTSNHIFSAECSGALEYYSTKANIRLELFDKQAIEKHAKLWDFVFNKQRHSDFFDIELRLVYKNYISPFLEKMQNYKLQLEKTPDPQQQPEQKEVSSKKESNLNENLHIIDILKNTSYWNYLKSELATKLLIDINTAIAIDDQKGNISYFIALIKHLHSKEYYNKNYKPKNKEIPIILENTFGIKTYENTCKKTKAKDFDFKHIKYASEIK